MEQHGTIWNCKGPEARESTGFWGVEGGWGRLWGTQVLEPEGTQQLAGTMRRQREFRNVDFPLRQREFLFCNI